jgi:diguanylate cyclase (GGDEF)-like protein
MDSQEPTRTLILSSHISNINGVLNLLRTAGLELKAQTAINKKDLYEQLKLDNWDLILCFEDSNVSTDAVKEILSSQGLELPVIYLAEDISKHNTKNLFQNGIQDCLSLHQENHIIMAIQRETRMRRLRLDHRLLQLDYKELQKRHQSLMDASSSALAYIQEGMHLYCNKSYAQIFSQKDHKALHNSPLLDLFEGKNREQIKTSLRKKIDSELKLTINLEEKHNSQTYSELDLSFVPVSYKGQACLQLVVKLASGNPVYASIVDTAKKQDLLTRLYNKEFFLETIESAIGKAIKQQETASLLIVQVNEFLDIKSTIGVGKANQVLTDIAAFLNKSIQKKFAAARLDDYQFGLLIDACTLAESIELANFIKGQINNHITTTALPSLQLSCSIGIASINENALDAEDLVDKARLNLQKTLPETSASTAQPHKQDVDALAAYIQLALKEQRFRLLFQPTLALREDDFQNYEVLCRMLDNDGNEILPSDFLPLIILNGMGEALDKAIVEIALYSLQSSTSENIRLAINLTPDTLLSKTFLPWLSETLQSTNINTDKLLFQISENHINNNLEYCTIFNNGLRELGIGNIVCHYGSTVNSAEYLEDIKPVYVKLDKSLVRDITYNPYQQDELKKLFTDLHNRKHKVTVPQVEDFSILPTLWRLGVDFIQGYCLERPRQIMDYEFMQSHELNLTTQLHKQSLR